MPPSWQVDPNYVPPPAKETWKRAVSTGIDFLPGPGDVKAAQEAITGENLITGEDLGPWERVLAGAGVLPFVPGMAGWLKKPVLGKIVKGVEIKEPHPMPFERRRIIADMLEEDKTYKEIQQAIGASPDAIKNVADIFGITASRETASQSFKALRAPEKVILTESQFNEKVASYLPKLNKYNEDVRQEALVALWREFNEHPGQSRTYYNMVIANTASRNRRGVSIDTPQKTRFKRGIPQTGQPLRIDSPQDELFEDWISRIIKDRHVPQEDKLIDNVDFRRYVDSLGDVERDYLRLRMEGNTDREIAKIWEIPSIQMQRMKKPLKEELYKKILRVLLVAAVPTTAMMVNDE